MIKFYQELNLLPQDETDIHFLWSKVFQQVHLGLVEMQNEHKQVSIGVSFPEYVVGEKLSVLGGKCRLFAEHETSLARFDAPKWLARLSDYVHCTGVRAVPNTPNEHAIYQRIQVKTNPERLARRYARRHGLSLAESLQHYDGMQPPGVPLPFIRLRSLSSEQTFCLWIKKTIVEKPQGGLYSTYGLSSQTTVPEF